MLSKWRFVHPIGSYMVRAVAADDRVEIATGHKDAREAIRETGIEVSGWPVVTDAVREDRLDPGCQARRLVLGGLQRLR